jgi:hypothetical protein
VDNTVDLLSVKFGEALLGHIVDEEVVANLGVGINALAVGLCNSLGKNTGIFGVVKQVDSGKLGVLVETVPVAGENFTLNVVGVDKNGLPFTTAIFIFKEALAGNWSKVALSIEAE